jgi:hypothetical protein
MIVIGWMTLMIGAVLVGANAKSFTAIVGLWMVLGGLYVVNHA